MRDLKEGDINKILERHQLRNLKAKLRGRASLELQKLHKEEFKTLVRNEYRKEGVLEDS